MPRIENIRQLAKQTSEKKSWYEFKASSASQDETDLFIYDVIAWFAVDAAQFVRDLQKVTSQKINLRINSPGGNVFDGIAIHNALKSHSAQVITHIDGWAASIASIIALAGDTVKMAKNAFFMIHNPWSMIAGDAQELRKEADVLDKITGSMVETYKSASGQSEKQIREWMSAETWFTADEAQTAGFASEVIAEMKIAASFDLSIFANVPDYVKERCQMSKPKPTERDLEKILRDSGFSRSEAVAITSTVFKGEPGQRDSVQIAEMMAQIKQNTAILTT